MGVVGRLDQYASMLCNEFDDYSMSENLLTYSNDFSQGVWAGYCGGKSNITYNTTDVVSPDGRNNSTKVARGSNGCDGSLSWGFFWNSSIGGIIIDTTNTFTASIYARGAVGGEVINVGFNDSQMTNHTLTTSWQRISRTGIANTTDRGFQVKSDNINQTFYIWEAQLERGSVATDHTPTTTTAISRVLPATTNTNITGLGTYYSSGFDENTSITTLVQTGENLFERSEEIDNTYWNKTNLSGTITANQTTAPDGTITADLYQEDATTIGRYVSKGMSVTSGTIYTVSIWAKQAPGSTRYLGLILPSAGFGVNVIVSFTLSGAGSRNISVSGTATAAEIQAYPDGWYRCYLASQATATASAGIQIRLSNSSTSGSASYAGDGTSGIYLWGAQFERSSAPTDYIPTTTTSLTRSLPSSTFALSANVFAPYDIVYDEFGGTLFGAGQGRYMRQNTDKSVIVYNEIDEVSDFRDIVKIGLVLDLDAGMNASYNGSGTTWTDLSGSSSSAVAVGQSAYTTEGTYTFIVPAQVTSISAVVIGGGGGGGGADDAQIRNETNNGGGGGGLAYGTIAVTPGETLNITVGTGGAGGVADAIGGGAGGTSTIVRSATTLLSGGGGARGRYRSQGLTDAGGASGGTARIGGGSGGNSGTGSGNSGATGGGGAGGYSGNGGAGGAFNSAGSASTGAGGGGGGGYNTTSNTLRAGGGGGTGILGSGADGTAGTGGSGGGGGGGSSGTSGGGNTTGLGGQYGGGGGGKSDSTAGTLTIGGAGTNGAVRILWGPGRSYPSTTVTDQTTVVGIATTSNNAQLINAPTYSSANGGYFVFNGTNQYVTSSFFTTLGQAVTYAGWLYSTETTATYRNFVDSLTVNPMIWWNTSGQIEFDAALYTTPAVYRNQWVYVALSKPSGNSSPSYYVNGVLVGSGTAYTTPAVTPTWFNRAAAQTWKGNASNVQAYNRALTASEVLQNYNALKHRFGL
jgi:hypothetical protein